ncbi:MAG: PD-(D/E)XK nuclease family protein [Candidatus Paceibacterota bacterium]
MSKYYNPQKTRNLFDPGSSEPFVVSRSGIDLFVQCPRCFYLDKRLGVARPPGYPFSLNSAVDTLLKKEFDVHRAAKSAHPLMKTYGVDAIPFSHEELDRWRDSLRHGIKYTHKKTNLILRGGIDDIWVNPTGELHIVDYKATSKSTEVTLDAEWQDGYKRQMEIYQWLFRNNGFKVSPVGYFVYCNGNADKEAFDAKLEFDVKIIPYTGDDSWVEGVITKLHKCLVSENIPSSEEDCDYCSYFNARTKKEA